jgi:hypothetical protein
MLDVDLAAMRQVGEGLNYQPLAEFNGCIYLDLVDANWQVVEVTAFG